MQIRKSTASQAREWTDADWVKEDERVLARFKFARSLKLKVGDRVWCDWTPDDAPITNYVMTIEKLIDIDSDILPLVKFKEDETTTSIAWIVGKVNDRKWKGVQPPPKPGDDKKKIKALQSKIRKLEDELSTLRNKLSALPFDIDSL